MRKGGTFQGGVAYEPLEKGQSRAQIGCNGARRSEMAPTGRLLTEKRQPALDFGLRDVTQKREMALAQQIALEKTQGHLVPFHRFWASMVTSLIPQVVLDRSLNELRALSLAWAVALT
jgi:hypothetical protein